MTTFRCVIHGSFSKHFDEIQRTHQLFTAAGIEILAPKAGDLAANIDGFAFFADERDMDPRMVELLYLHHLKELGENGFSYFVNPEGYIGKSASYELGIAQLTGVRCFFSHKPVDHPAYVAPASVWSPEQLINYILATNELPEPQIDRDEAMIYRLWQELVVPGSIVATGGIIEYDTGRTQPEKEVLLVKTHKWGDRYSIVGGKVRRGERLEHALLREVKEETGLSAEIGQHICTFDQIKNSGYYRGTQHIFVDNVVRVRSKNVVLNDEAEDYLWALPSEALAALDIEPNARETLELYTKLAPAA